MDRFYSNGGSTKAALQQRPKVLHALYVNLPIDVLLKMVHKLMFVLRFEIVVASELISHNRRTRLNKVAHCPMHGGILAISNHPRLDLSAALKCANDHSLSVSALHPDAIAETTAFALVHVASLATDV